MDKRKWANWVVRAVQGGLRNPKSRKKLILTTLEDRLNPTTIFIDTFEGPPGTNQDIQVSGAGPASVSGTFDAAYIAGGERDLTVNKVNGPAGPIVQGLETGGSMNLNTPLNVNGTMRIVWDGNDNNAGADALGLGLNLTGLNQLIVDAETDLTGAGSQIRLRLVDTGGDVAERTLPVPTSTAPIVYNIASFTNIAAVDLANIGRIELDVLTVPAAGDVEIRLICATTSADLELDKAIVTPGPYAVGDTVQYTVTVNNLSTNGAATNLVVFDQLPAQLTFVSSSATLGSYNSGTNLWTVGTLNPGASATLTINATINSSGTINNYAEIDSFQGTDPDSTPGNRSNNEDDDDNVQITASGVDFGDAPDTYGTTLAASGARHTHTGLTLGVTRDTETNGQPNGTATGDDAAGADDEDGVTLGALGQGLTPTVLVNVGGGAGFLNAWVDFNADGDFADPGEQVATNRAVVVGANAVPITVPVGATIGNSFARFRLTAASVVAPSPTGAQPTGEVEDYQVSIVGGPFPDLELTKTVDNPTPTLGSTVQFNLIVANQSLTGATNVVVRDQLPAGLTFVSAAPSVGTYSSVTGLWTIGNLASLNLATLTINATVSGSGTIINSTEILTTSPGDTDSIPGNGSTTEDDDDSVTLNVAQVDFGDAPATYGTTLAANGARHIATGITLGANRDVENNGVPGAAADGDDSAGVPDDEDGVAFPTFPNGARLTRGQTDNLIVNVGTNPGFLNAWIDLNQNGTFEPTEQFATDLPVVVGNNNVPLTLAPGVNLGTTYLRFRVTDAPVGGSPSPTGLFASGEVEDYSAIVVDRSDLSLTKTVSNTTPDIGDQITYTVTVSNAGPSAANNVTVNDVLPAGVTFVSSSATLGSYNSGTGIWTVGTLAGSGGGSAATLQIVATVTQPGTILNPAEVRASDSFDPDSTPNNGSTTEDDDDRVTITVADLDFGDSPGTQTTLPSGARHRATGIRLGATRDSENDGQPNATATGDGADEDGVTGIATLTQGSISTVGVDVQNAGGPGFINAWIDLNADGDYSDVGEQVLTNSPVAGNGVLNLPINVPLLTSPNVNTFARVRISTQNNLLPTGLATDGEVEDYAVLLRQEADLSLDKTVNNSAPNIGEQVTFNVAVGNLGPNPATGVTVLDQLPAGLQFVSASTTTGTYASGTGIWTIGTLAPLGVASLDIVALVTASGTITNSAQVQTSNQFDPDSTPGDNSTTQDDDDPETLTVPATDFGDAPATYGTLLADNGARHQATGVFMGTNRDGENNGVPTAGSTGDDSAGVPDDEDGVFVGPTVTIGSTQTIQVVSSGAGFVNAWIDYNVDGDWLDAGEQVLTNQPVVAGLNSFLINIPTTATSGASHVRVRISDAAPVVPSPLGLLPTGEVEDLQITLLRQDDFGDAPASYGTLLANDGARHRITPGGPVLGAAVDAEADAAPSAGATGDDTTGTDDEDAVVVPALLQGGTVNATVSAPFGGRLDAFVDFNADGDFADAGERVTPAGGTFLANGANSIPIAVPATATTGNTFARFRISTVGNLGPTGGANDGEVEDYPVAIGAGLGNFGDRVWIDINNNGVDDPGEPGLVGALVQTISFGSDNALGGVDDQVFNTVTGAGGVYAFNNVPQGIHQVTVTPPVGFTPTFDRDGVGSPNVATFTLPPATTVNDVDFGYRGTATLGDLVWYDLNATGAAEVSEPGVPNAQVTLTWFGPNGAVGGGDDFVFTPVNTSATGAYSYGNLPPGNYAVGVNTASLPAGITQTFDIDGTGSANVATVSLTAGQNRTDADFGYRGNASLGDLVWYDIDGGGTQNLAEPGIAGVTVTVTYSGLDGNLATAADNVNFVVPTNATGNWSLGNLPTNGGATNYRVTTSTIPASFTSQTFDLDGTASPNTADITLAPNQNRTDVDFGYRNGSSISNFVWEDLDGDGIQDGGEPGINGVTVDLFDATGTNLLATTSTAGPNGTYAFNNLAAGTYQIRFTTPIGFVRTPANIGVNDAIDSDGSVATGFTLPIVLGTNVADVTVDQGMYRPITIGDRVWYDVDGDSVQDAGEPGIAGATVQVNYFGPDGVDGGTDDQIFGPITAPNGIWTIANLPPGNYSANIIGLPNGLTVSTLNSTPFSLVSGVNRTDIDFGFRGNGSIGDLVWTDVNRDGLSAGEPGIAGVGVTLTWFGFDDAAGGSDDIVYPVATTTAAGAYGFANLPFGNFRVDVNAASLPAGLVPIFDLDSGLVAPNNSTAVTLTAGTPAVANADFGYDGNASFGDRIWLDVDGDGVQDAGEPGMVGVSVAAVWAGPDNQFGGIDDVAIPTVVTGVNGAYTFTQLAPGNYQAFVIGGLPPSVVNTGDPDATLDSTTTFTLGANSALTNIDWGYRGAASVSGFVYRDNDIDGIREPLAPNNETGIAGVTVTLTGTDSAGNVINRNVPTDANGAYSFTGLLAGTYTITETQPPVVPAVGGVYDGLDTPGTATAGGSGAAGPKNVLTATLNATSVGTEFNFGEIPPADPFGFVYIDLDADGIREPLAPNNEPGIAGVTVTLSGTAFAGTPLARPLVAADVPGGLTRVTDATGFWQFLVVPPGTYQVVEAQPAAFTDGLEQNADTTLGRPPVVVGNDIFSNIVLAGLDLRGPFNFGEIASNGSLAGAVFIDNNTNGLRDPGEIAVPGTVVTLVGTTLAGRPVNATVITDAAGNYSFQQLKPGVYNLFETQPPNLADRITVAGTAAGVAGVNLVAGINLGPNVAATGYNFGEGTVLASALSKRDFIDILGAGPAGLTFPPAGTGVTILGPAADPSGYVYIDANRNGVRDADEAGIAGVRIDLEGVTTTGEVINQTTYTDRDGFYQFDFLEAGTYAVRQFQPDGFLDGLETVGDLGGTAGNDIISGIKLAAGQVGRGYNFGEYAPAPKVENAPNPVIVTPTPNLPTAPPATQQPSSNDNSGTGTRVNRTQLLRTRTSRAALIAARRAR